MTDRAFEEWYEAEAMPLEHSNWFEVNELGLYKISCVQNAYEGWQAAKALYEPKLTEGEAIKVISCGNEQYMIAKYAVDALKAAGMTFKGE